MADAAIEKVMAVVAAQPLAAANSVPPLIAKLADPAAHSQEALVKIIVTLQLFFADAWKNSAAPTAKRRKGPAGAAADEGDAAAVYAAWLARQRAAFEQRLLALLAGPDSTLQVAALQAVMSLVQQGQQRHMFDVELFRRALAAALGPALSGSLPGALTRKYMAHADVRYHTLMAVQSLATQLKAYAAGDGGNGNSGGITAGGNVGSSDGRGGDGRDSQTNAGSSSAGSGSAVSEAECARPLLEVLLHAPPMPPAEDFPDSVSSWSGAAEAGAVRAAASGQRRKRKAEAGSGDGEAVRWLSWEHQRRAFSSAWLAVLRCKLPGEAYHQVLVRMHSAVIPAMPNPLLLADFLSASVDQGGMTGMLALNGLFILVTKHGLEYPAFYRRLYGLLALDTFQAKERAQFFQLADVFLASGMVPAYTAAAFVKKFARLALRTTPAGAVICLAFMHNLLRRHPATTQLLHRPPPKPRAVEAEDTAAAADSAAHTSLAAAAAAAAADTADPAAGAGHAAAASAPAAMPAPAAVRDPAVAIAGQPARSGGRTADAAAADVAAVGTSAVAAAPETLNPRANGLAYGTASSGGSGGDSSSSDGSSSDDGLAADAPASGSLPAAAAVEAPTEAAPEAGSTHPGVDPYDEAEPDPARCRALESSLWEVTALRAHYDPQVANFTAILDKDLSDRRRTAEMDIQPLLTDSYTGRIKAELGKRLKAAPMAFYAEPPKSLFAANATGGPLPGWDFSV